MQKSLNRTQSDVVEAPLKPTGVVSSCNLLEAVEGLTPAKNMVPDSSQRVKTSGKQYLQAHLEAQGRNQMSIVAVIRGRNDI